MSTTSGSETRTLLLTGASRGIGHSTVKRFSSAGWRVLTCSRNAFPDNCPWEAGEEDHVQVDLSSPDDTIRAIDEIKERLGGRGLQALVNNAGMSPKDEDGGRLSTLTTDLRTWGRVFHVNFFSSVVLARGLFNELKAVEGRDRQRHLYCGCARSSFRGCGLCHIKSCVGCAHP